MIDWDYNISEVNNIAREWFSLKLTINQFQLFWQLSLHNIKNNTSTFTADPITTTQKTLCYQFLKMIPTNFIKEPDKCSKEPLLALFQLLIITSNTEESKTNSFTPEAFSANCNNFFMEVKLQADIQPSSLLVPLLVFHGGLFMICSFVLMERKVLWTDSFLPMLFKEDYWLVLFITQLLSVMEWLQVLHLVIDWVI